MASEASVVPVASYTSYPTVEHFGAFSYGDYLRAVAAVRIRSGLRNRVLHLQIPSISSGSHSAGPDTKERARPGIALYLDYLKREIEIQGELFANMNELDELHLCGGIATCCTDRQLSELLAQVRRYFKLVPEQDGEFVLRVDPRTITPARLDSMRAQGFNRVIVVAIMDGQTNTLLRTNALAVTAAMARDAGFRSISIELLFSATQHHAFAVNGALARVIAASPERITIVNAAHSYPLRTESAQLPARQTGLNLWRLCVKRLGEAGYLHLGMEQFVRPNDELAVAQQQGRLHRHLQGYSIHPEADVIACGPGAIGAVGATYSQNHATQADYYAPLDINALPIARGVRLSMDDALRRRIIAMLMCHFELAITSLELGYPITFATYFADEIVRLRGMEAEGLLTVEAEWLTVTAKGRLKVRDICQVFDRGLAHAQASFASPVDLVRGGVA